MRCWLGLAPTSMITGRLLSLGIAIIMRMKIQATSASHTLTTTGRTVAPVHHLSVLELATSITLTSWSTYLRLQVKIFANWIQLELGNQFSHGRSNAGPEQCLQQRLRPYHQRRLWWSRVSSTRKSRWESSWLLIDMLLPLTMTLAAGRTPPQQGQWPQTPFRIHILCSAPPM